ncbi:Nucleotidylyl transferase [Tilletiaria anomala UBC 951]|uniref:Tyrosine--tRNA ligase n=1 Tax=Tilletiaria anomala (strain ATCC 24038 / CBS 436.72 / UBC 951) TaxID=1037660 RepID=A0A066WFP0_TILAU|nr:Nucleotidylyl transferase [Tilletiaria anomala UBC 951]KDN49570.1 Nucleotidylyl transferase [Tilletiaria anomala UBC 951]
MSSSAAALDAQLSIEAKYDLITRDLQEVLGGDKIKDILRKGERPLRCYWGTAPTGRPHIGYFVPFTKLADFLKAGTEVKVLLADIHAFLDNMKAPITLVRHRVEYYRLIIRTVLKAIGVPVERLNFVVGSSYQLTEAYNMDQYRLCAMVTEHDAKRAGAEVVKQVSSPLLSSMLYPGLQALDEQYLDVDFQFGGVDQRKIFVYAEDILPKLGYAKRAHLMNSMVPGLKGSKMSASDAGSKVDFLDTPKDIAKKLNEAHCIEGQVEENGVLAFVKNVIFPIERLREENIAGGNADLLDASKGASKRLAADGAPPNTLFSINRPDKFGGGLHYSTYEAVEKDFVDRRLHPADLKQGVADAISTLLEPVRKEFESNADFQKIAELAYPSEKAAAPKKVVKPKNPRFAHMFTKEEGGTAETAEDAQAAKAAHEAAIAAGQEPPPPPKQAKAATSSTPKQPKAAPKNEPSRPLPSQIDLRVGKIVDIKPHPDADSLYLESVDFGEPDGPRTVLSGLVKYVPIEKMSGRLVVGVCNLKPAAMRGIKSHAMLLCATHKSGKDGGVEPVAPPEGSQPGDKLWVEGYEGREPDAQLNPKKKIFETIQPAYLTTESREAAWKGVGPDEDETAEPKVRLIKGEKGVCFAPAGFEGAGLS